MKWYIDYEKYLFRVDIYDSDTDSTDYIIIHEGDFDSFLYGNKNESKIYILSLFIYSLLLL